MSYIWVESSVEHGKSHLKGEVVVADKKELKRLLDAGKIKEVEKKEGK